MAGILKDRGCGRAPSPCAGAMALARLVGARKETPDPGNQFGPG